MSRTPFPCVDKKTPSARKLTHPASATLRCPDGTDELLERVFRIAEDLADVEAHGPAGQKARRSGKRIMKLLDELDELLGLGQ